MKLSTYLKQENETALAFAHRVKVSAASVCRLLTGARMPSVELAQNIYKATAGKVGLADWHRAKKGPFVVDEIDI